MAKSNRKLVAPFAALLVCLASAGILRAAEAEKAADADNPAKAQLEQVAETVVAAAKDSIAAAKNDQDAVKRAQVSFEILRNIGELGGFDTSAQSDKLMDDLRASAQPSVVEAIIQMQFTKKVRTWVQMNDTERAAVLDSFVADVKNTGLTPGLAESFSRLSGMFSDRADPSMLIAKAIAEVLPFAAETDDPKAKRKFAMLAGINRRLTLVGKPFELEGKLLDGSTFDWSAYKGKVVLIDFYASWCGPCKAEAPNVLKNYKAYHDKGFEVVTVNLDLDSKLAEKYIKDTGCDFPTIFSDDPKGWETPMATYYGINAIPRVILVGKDGNVVSTSARGPMLGEFLTKLLGPPAEGAETTGDEGKSTSTEPAGDPSAREAALRAVLLERIKQARAKQPASATPAEKN